MRFKLQRVLLPLLLLLLVPMISQDVAPRALAVSSPPTVSVSSDNYGSSNITDPSVLPGTLLNFSVDVSNLPNVVDNSQGGLQGFDITLHYNASILSPVASGFAGNFCTSLDGCLFSDLTPARFALIANQTSLPDSGLRIGMVGYNRADRVTGSGTLFRVEFLILNRGNTMIQIDGSKSILLGFSQNCESIISGYNVSNLEFDNRKPWIVTANPTAVSMHPGSTTTVSVTVTRVNTNDTVVLLISNAINFTYTFAPDTWMLNKSAAGLSFTSILTLNSLSTASVGDHVVQIIAHSSTPGGFLEYRLNYTILIDPPMTPMNPSSTLLSSLGSPQQAPFVTRLTSPDPSLPILANFTFASSSTNAQQLIFSSSLCGGTGPYSYSWNFGDGTTGSGNIVSHTFSGPGLYKVTLKVSDSTGSNFTVTQNINIRNTSSEGSSLIIAGGLSSLLIIVALGVYLWRSRRP
jgi:PKD repeat protein